MGRRCDAAINHLADDDVRNHTLMWRICPPWHSDARTLRRTQVGPYGNSRAERLSGFSSTGSPAALFYVPPEALTFTPEQGLHPAAFTTRRGRCFRMVLSDQLPTTHSAPVVWRGRSGTPRGVGIGSPKRASGTLGAEGARRGQRPMGPPDRYRLRRSILIRTSSISWVMTSRGSKRRQHGAGRRSGVRGRASAHSDDRGGLDPRVESRLRSAKSSRHFPCREPFLDVESVVSLAALLSAFTVPPMSWPTSWAGRRHGHGCLASIPMNPAARLSALLSRRLAGWYLLVIGRKSLRRRIENGSSITAPPGRAVSSLVVIIEGGRWEYGSRQNSKPGGTSPRGPRTLDDCSALVEQHREG